MKPSYFLAISAGIGLLIFGVLIGIFFLIFSLVKTLSYSDVFAFLHSGDTAGVSYFEMTSNESCYLQGPDTSQAIRVERRKFYVTAYCPPATGYHTIEGGQMSSAGIKLAMGAVAVPPFSTPPIITGNTPDYPWGTTFDIPGYGRGIAVDHGAAIQKAGVSNGRWKATPYDHLDIFVGWGTDQCAKQWQTKVVEATVYWFDPKIYPSNKATQFIHRICGGSGWGGGSVSVPGGRILNVPCIGEDCASQCGVASSAMVIAFLTHKSYTTKQLAGGCGTIPIVSTLTTKTGMIWISTGWNFDRAARSILADYPVILYSRYPTNHATQHIMVMRGYQNGKFLINNPYRGGSSACNQLWATAGEITQWGCHDDGCKMIFPNQIR